MERRTYLAALSASSLAGCLGQLGASGLSSGGTPFDDPPDDVQRLVALESVDDDGAGHDVQIDAEVVESSVTADHPARVRVTTTNEGRKRDVSVTRGQCCLFNRSAGASDPAGLWLHRVGSADHVERDGDRWTRDAPVDQHRVYAAYGCLARTYESGESVTNEYYVWDDYRVEGYFPPGTYRFAEPVTVSEPGTGSEDGPIATFTWGFSVRVERP